MQSATKMYLVRVAIVNFTFLKSAQQHSLSATMAEIIAEKWSKATKLGAAADYVLRHYQKLTAYLDNPIISISNDFSERMLRIGKFNPSQFSV